MCVGLSAKVVRISDGTAVVDARWCEKGSVFRVIRRSGAGRLRDGARRSRNCKDHRRR